MESALQSLMDAIREGNVETVTELVSQDRQLIHQRDATGATPLHVAALCGQRDVARLLLDQGADMNALDDEFQATPMGWAVEYLRARGGYLAIELEDFAYAIQNGDRLWVTRFLQRFPNLREASDIAGRSFRQLAADTNNQEIINLLAAEPS